jgi:hypothetical protein
MEVAIKFPPLSSSLSSACTARWGNKFADEFFSKRLTQEARSSLLAKVCHGLMLLNFLIYAFNELFFLHCIKFKSRLINVECSFHALTSLKRGKVSHLILALGRF